MKSSAPVRPARKRRRPAAPIIAALSVESDSGGTNTGRPCARSARFGVGAQPAVGRDAAGDADAPRAEPARRLERPVEQGLDDDALEAGGDVGDQRRRAAAAPSGLRLPARDAQHRRLETAEAEVDAPRDVRRQQLRRGRSRGALRSACVSRVTGKANRAIVARLASRSITGPPGYPSPSSFATLSYASPAASSRVRPIRRVTGRARRRGTGWCARRRRRGPPPAAAARRARASAIRCARRGDAPG